MNKVIENLKEAYKRHVQVGDYWGWRESQDFHQWCAENPDLVRHELARHKVREPEKEARNVQQ